MQYSQGIAQNWVQSALFNNSPTSLYSDTAKNLFYLGGSFKFNDIDTFNGICYWDGKYTYEMDRGRYDACGNNACHSLRLTTGYKGEIYVGMTEKEIGGKVVNGIARWNGSSWSSLGLGLRSPGNDVGWALGSCIKDDKLYLAGQFTTAGSDTCNSIGVWDGETWQSLGFPPDTLNSYPPALTSCIFYKNELYAAGNCYNNIGGYINRGIARFDGQKWKRVGEGLKGGYTDIRDMEVYKGDLYVCGYFTAAAGNAGNKIMRWDGEQWKDVAGGLCSPSDIAENMLVYDGKLYVVGVFECVGNGLPAQNIAVWDGERWCSMGNSKINNKILAIAPYNNDLYIVGGFTEIDGQPLKFFAKWVGDHATDTCSTPTSYSHIPNPEIQPVLHLTPNPASDYCALSLTGVWPIGERLRASIYNVLGQQVWAAEWATDGTYTMPVTGWAKGVYELRVSAGRLAVVGRLVVAY